jgi:hypothetical protein
VATREPEGTHPAEVSASGRLQTLRPGQLPWSQGIFEACGAATCKSKASVVSANRPVAARGFFAAPSAAFDRHRSGALEDFTGRIAAGGQARHRLSMIFHLLRSVRTRAGPLATTPTERRSADRGPRPILSWGSRPACPSTDITQARPHPSASSCPETPSGRRHHPSSSRSALVVSHHPDGFLRAKARGFVAPRCRS